MTYYNALTFYRNIKFLNGENIPGISTLFDALKQFFKGGKPKKKAPETTPEAGNTPSQEG